MQFDTRRDEIEGGRTLVLETRRTGADHNDMSLHQVTREIGLEHSPDGHIPLWYKGRVPHPHAALGIRGDDESTHLDMVDARVLAQASFAAGARRLDDVGGSTSLGDPQGFEHQRRIEVVSQPKYRRHAADDSVPFGRHVEAPVAGGGIFDFGQVHHRTGERRQEAAGIVAAERKSLLDRRLARQVPVSERESGNHVGVGDGGGQDAVMIGDFIAVPPKRPHRRSVGP